MIRLTSAATKLQFKTSVAVTTDELPIVVSYSDKTESHYIGNTQATTSTGSTIVDICSPPIFPAIRDIDTITVFNADTTSKLIYIYYLNGATTYTIISVTLAVEDKLEYIHGNGWKTTSSTGAIKTVSVSASSGIADINTDTTASQTLTVGTTGTDFAIVDDLAGDHKFNLPDAGAAARGVVTFGAQTLAGAKTFSTAPILSSLTASEILALDGSKNIQTLAVATYPSLAELAYVKGVTSAIQTQLSQQKIIDVITPASFVVTSPADSTTMYFGIVTTLATNANAALRQFQLPTGVLRRASFFIDPTTLVGTTEAITINLRNITDTTSTLLGTITSDVRGNRSYSGAISVATDATKFYSVEVVYPAFATNPTGVEWSTTLIIFEA